MGLEWAWLKEKRPIAAPRNEIVLERSADCRVLLLHGLTGTPTEFGYVANHLFHRGNISVECRQLVNHGQPIGVLARTSWEQLYASARSHFLEARARTQAANIPLIIGGLSAGAVMSLLLAADYPDDVSGVMCLSPALFYDGWNVPWIQRLLALADYLPIKYFLYLREGPPYGLRDEALRKRVAAAYEAALLGDDKRASEMGYAHFPIALFCEMRHLVARCIGCLPRVKSPLLLLQATQDESTSPRNAQFIYDRVASTDKEIVLLQNSYHVITADLERTAVAEAMTRFCRRLAQRAQSPVEESVAHE